MNHVRLRRVSLRFALASGAVVGFVVGLFVGSLLGAVIAWVAGALLDWQRQLAFTLGVTEELLPLGEQQGLLQTVQGAWWLVVPGVGLAVGVLSGLAGALGTALTAALFNRFGRGTEVAVEASEAPLPPADVARFSTGARPLPSGSDARPRAAPSAAPPRGAPPRSGTPPRGAP